MHPSSRLPRWLRSARTWSVLGILAPIGMLAISGLMLLELRNDAWDKAGQTSRNLLEVIERDIARNVEIIDLSLRGVVDKLFAPGVLEADPDLRQLILFDRTTTATDMGVLLVLNEHGDTMFDSLSVPARKLNNADREYFRAHAERDDLGLFISKPLVSRLLKEPIIVLSRRIAKPDGRFGGIVSASLKLSYFHRLFQNIGLGAGGAINLYLRDGTRLMRHPYVEADIGTRVAESPLFQRFLREGRGAFVGTSTRDGVERFYTHTSIPGLPLLLHVALGTEEIEAEWRAKALVIGLMVLALCSLTIVLSLLFGRELRRRAAMQAELTRLSRTDVLTDLSNRRRFEEELAGTWGDPASWDLPRALLVIDADHFKAINDRHGHAVGDAVLKGLARCLSASAKGRDDLVCRVGGEEFVVLLPGAGEADALRIADRIHAQVAKLSFGTAGLAQGAVTVSIGVACAAGGGRSSMDGRALYRLADAAVYAAKAQGRNQTRRAELPAPAEPAAARAMSWVDAG